MIKFVYCVRKKPGLSNEEFYDYWLNKHGPLVREHAKALGMKKYIQSHTLGIPELQQVAQAPRGTMEPYDGVTEIWWESMDDLVAAAQSAEGQEANQLLTEDEARFVDLANSNVFFSQEHTIFDS